MNNLVQNTCERLYQAVVSKKEEYLEEALKRFEADTKTDRSTCDKGFRNVREDYPFVYEDYYVNHDRIILNLTIESISSPTHLTYKITPIYYYGNEKRIT